MIGPDGKPASPEEVAQFYLDNPDIIFGRKGMREMVQGLLDRITALEEVALDLVARS